MSSDPWKVTWDWATSVWGADDERAFNAFFRRVACIVAEREGWEEVGSSDVWHASYGAVQSARKQNVTTRMQLVKVVLDYHEILFNDL